eukprot:Phypoly_transcript_09389.p1 GENE.Phypoly_transcript_09389~~Phypoly_transcript_09389.p1  ORF type:complete len:438 (+),score=41.45 Phypoly_transcript_09389:95-1315(+)
MTLSPLFLLLAFLFSITYAQAPTPAGNGTSCSKGAFFTGQYANGDGSWVLNWEINCDDSTFSGVVAAKGSGWVGFGLNNAAQMPGSYVLQAGVVNGKSQFQVGFNKDYDGPTAVPTANQIYSQLNASENSTHTTVGFTRSLTLSGSNSSLFSIVPAGNILLWAYSQGQDSFTVQHDFQAAVQVNFFTGKTKKPRDYQLIHGSLMLLAWGFLAPAGTFVARYLKGIGHPWYLIHIGIQYTVLGLTVASFIIIENNLGGMRDNHFQNPHEIIGLTIVILTFIQVLFGILANTFFKPGREGAPFFPDKIHWWLGRLVLLYAFANCFIGFDQYGFTHVHNQPFISFAVWLGLVAVLFLIAEIITGKSTHSDVTDSKFKQFRVPIVTYILMFVFGFVLYGVTLHEMYNWSH